MSSIQHWGSLRFAWRETVSNDLSPLLAQPLLPFAFGSHDRVIDTFPRVVGGDFSVQLSAIPYY